MHHYLRSRYAINHYVAVVLTKERFRYGMRSSKTASVDVCGGDKAKRHSFRPPPKALQREGTHQRLPPSLPRCGTGAGILVRAQRSQQRARAQTNRVQNAVAKMNPVPYVAMETATGISAPWAWPCRGNATLISAGV